MTITYIKLQVIASALKQRILNASCECAYVIQPYICSLKATLGTSSIWLHISLISDIPGIFISAKHFQKYFQKQDLIDLTSLLSEAIVQDVKVAKTNRILSIVFNKNQHELFLHIHLFGHPSIYIVDHSGTIVYATRQSKIGSLYTPPLIKIQNAESPTQSASDVDQTSSSYQDLIDFETKLQARIHHRMQEKALAHHRKKIHSIEIKIQDFKDSLNEYHNWPLVIHTADLLKSHLHLAHTGQTEIEVLDWTKDNAPMLIKLDPRFSPYEQLEKLYQRARKYKKAIPIVEQLLHKQEEELALHQNCIEKIHVCRTPDELLPFLRDYEKTTPKKENERKKLPYYMFLSSHGFEILVGRSSKDNDIVTFQIARREDIWLHVHTMSGPHVIIRNIKGRIIDSQTIYEAAQLALYFSKVRGTSTPTADVIVTERKYVAKIRKAAPGKVSIAKFKTIHVKLDSKIIHALKERGL